MRFILGFLSSKLGIGVNVDVDKILGFAALVVATFSAAVLESKLFQK